MFCSGIGTYTPKLPPFIDNQDNIDAYMRRFEMYVIAQHWPEEVYLKDLFQFLTSKMKIGNFLGDGKVD